jgi:transposase
MGSTEAVGVALSVSDPTGVSPVLKREIVDEVLARLRRGEGIRALARSYGVEAKTIRAWRARGQYRVRAGRKGSGLLAPFAAWLRARAPEVAFNAAVLHRELVAQGFTGSAVIVRRFLQPVRAAARPAAAATVRFETAPGQQGQVDFGECRLWIGDAYLPAQLFVFVLSYSRRTIAFATPRARLSDFLAGHEQAFQHFGGVPECIVHDNLKPAVLGHTAEQILWHPVYADFAAYYGFRPWAHWPYRPQTKGKVESGVKYVKRNALAGKRFGSWTHLNAWLLEWATTIADPRVHGTTHEVPLVRFAAERLTPLDGRPPYQRERVQHRIVARDALVAIGGSRYSVPAQYVGATVTVHQHPDGYDILVGEHLVARHPRRERHQVQLDPAHYAGLTGAAGRRRLPPAPPRWDPGYPVGADVEMRDLAVYAALVEESAA